MNRTKNAIRNVFWGVNSKLLNIIFAFISRTVFIKVLGSVYLGVNGLYSEILSLLSFAELGFGTAMTFSMYKPVADQDLDRVLKLLNFYKSVYRIIAAVIAILGICLVPFLHIIVKGADWLSIGELRCYFLIYLFNTVIGYFVTYRYTYLNALQKNYIQTNIDTIVNIVSYSVQIITILSTKNFMGYLLANSMVLLISRIFIIVYLNRKFPILREKSKICLSKTEKRPIYDEVKGLAVHQFASVAVHSTDNILISTMTKQGIEAVGLISNYNLIINSVLGFVVILFNSVTSGFGNLAVSSTTERFRKTFKEMNFINFWIYGFCSISLWILLPPFIELWIGPENIIDETVLVLIILNCYLQGQSTVYNNVRVAKGNFNKDKIWAIIQALTNLIVSIICAKKYGVVGIYVGTIVSRLVYVVFRPYSTYRFLFEESAIEYYKKLIQYFTYVILVGIITKIFVVRLLHNLTYVTFGMSVVLVAIVPNICFWILTFKTNEFVEWKKRILTIVAKK